MEARSTMSPSAGSGPAPQQKTAILLTCYMTGATAGQNLGVAGYSYDIVAQLFAPLLSEFGEVIPVVHPKENLAKAAREVRGRGLEPVHVSFLPLQDVVLCDDIPNVVVPAWEFPDVPNQPFGFNPQNDWPATARKCASIIVGGQFTVDAFRKAGTTGRIDIVPVPTPEDYFQTPLWHPANQRKLDFTSYSFRNVEPETVSLKYERLPPPRPRLLKRIGKSIEVKVRTACKRALGGVVYGAFTEPVYSLRKIRDKWRVHALPYESASQLDLDGIVYTSIFNPADGRKNWPDLLTGFLLGLGDCDDATLVVKLISSNPQAIGRVLDYYHRRNIKHRCRLVFVTGFLSHEEMLALTEASTYYFQTTKAEGNCLPLMNYLAAGRPGISPCHSAIGDYFDDQVGFVIQSNPEPAAWPHDMRLQIRTTWGRIVWPDVVEQIRRSYDLAKNDYAGYCQLAERGRARMAGWCRETVVQRRLREALQAVLPHSQTSGSSVALEGWRRAA